MKRLNFLLVTFLLFMLNASLFADADQKRRSIETEVEARITSDIRKYYPELKFLLTAEASVTEEFPAEEDRDSRDLLLPGVKGFESEKKKSGTQPIYTIERVIVKLLVDKNSIRNNAELIRLLENIVFYSGKLDRARGDRAEIQEITFPHTNDELNAQLLAAQGQQPVVTQKEEGGKVVYDTIRTVQPGQQMQEQIAQKPSDKIELNPLMIGLFLLVVGLIIAIVMMMRKMNMEKQRSIHQIEEIEKKHEVEEASLKEKDVMLMLPESIQRANQKTEIDKTKSMIITNSVGRPDVTVAVVREMINDPQKRDKAQAALSEIGQSVVAVMREHLSDGEAEQLNKIILESPQRSLEEVQEAIMEFHNAFQLKKFTTAKSEVQNPFAFLEKMTEPQLYLLMKDEPPGIIAIILSQINSVMAGNLLRNLPSMHQGEVALELAKLQRLTSDAYLSVARDLAAKASKIPSINNVQVQGSDLLLDIFDNMDEAAEHSINEFIKVMNVELYKEISSQRVAFSSLDTLDDRVIRQIMRDISGEEMAIALKNAPENIQERFLSVLPSKAKSILQEHMEGIESVSPEDEQKVRRRITRLVRNYLRMQKKSAPTK